MRRGPHKMPSRAGRVFETSVLDTVDIDIYAGFTGVELTASSRTGTCLSYRQ